MSLPRRMRRNRRGSTAAVIFACGFVAAVAVNQLRWAIWPLSGGPIGINKILGGPAEPGS